VGNWELASRSLRRGLSAGLADSHASNRTSYSHMVALSPYIWWLCPLTYGGFAPFILYSLIYPLMAVIFKAVAMMVSGEEVESRAHGRLPLPNYAKQNAQNVIYIYIYIEASQQCNIIVRSRLG